MKQFLCGAIVFALVVLINPLALFAEDASSNTTTGESSGALNPPSSSDAGTMTPTDRQKKLDELRGQKQDVMQQKQDAMQENMEARKANMQQNTDARKENMIQNADERKANMEGKIEDRQAQMEEKKAQMEERQTERREKLAERAKERIKAYVERMVKRFLAAIERLNQIAGRVQSRIDKLVQEGQDVSSAQSALDIAKAKIAEATVAVNAILPSIDTVVSAEDPHGQFENVRNAIKKAKDALMAAHRSLIDAITTLKGLRAPGASAATTSTSGE